MDRRMHSQTSKHGAGQRPCVLILFEFRRPVRRQPATVAARCIFEDNQSVGNTINNSIFRPMGGQWASSPLTRYICRCGRSVRK